MLYSEHKAPDHNWVDIKILGLSIKCKKFSGGAVKRATSKVGQIGKDTHTARTRGIVSVDDFTLEFTDMQVQSMLAAFGVVNGQVLRAFLVDKPFELTYSVTDPDGNPITSVGGMSHSLETCIVVGAEFGSEFSENPNTFTITGSALTATLAKQDFGGAGMRV